MLSNSTSLTNKTPQGQAYFGSPTFIQTERVVLTCIGFAIHVAGLVGNTVAIAVFSRKLFASTTVSLFLRFLAASEIASVLSFDTICVRETWRYDFFPSSFACVELYLYSTCIKCSHWSLTLVTLERVTAVLLPHKVKVMWTIRKCCILLFITCVIFSASNIFILYSFETVERDNFTSCQYKNNKSPHQGIILYDVISESILPGFLIIIGNGIIVSRLWKRKNLKLIHPHRRGQSYVRHGSQIDSMEEITTSQDTGSSIRELSSSSSYMSRFLINSIFKMRIINRNATQAIEERVESKRIESEDPPSLQMRKDAPETLTTQVTRENTETAYYEIVHPKSTPKCIETLDTSFFSSNSERTETVQVETKQEECYGRKNSKHDNPLFITIINVGVGQFKKFKHPLQIDTASTDELISTSYSVLGQPPRTSESPHNFPEEKEVGNSGMKFFSASPEMKTAILDSIHIDTNFSESTESFRENLEPKQYLEQNSGEESLTQYQNLAFNTETTSNNDLGLHRSTQAPELHSLRLTKDFERELSKPTQSFELEPSRLSQNCELEPSRPSQNCELEPSRLSQNCELEPSRPSQNCELESSRPTQDIGHQPSTPTKSKDFELKPSIPTQGCEPKSSRPSQIISSDIGVLRSNAVQQINLARPLSLRTCRLSKSRQFSKEAILSVLLVTNSIVFLLTNAPNIVLSVKISLIDYFRSEPMSDTTKDLYYYFTLLSTVNVSLNFLCYCLTGSQFRAELKSMMVSCYSKCYNVTLNNNDFN